VMQTVNGVGPGVSTNGLALASTQRGVRTMTVDEFLESGLRNASTYEQNVKAYVRRSKRRLPDEDILRSGFDIATVDVDNPGCGQFKAWFAVIATKITARPELDYIFIEEVINPTFRLFFLRGKWIQSNSGTSFFLLINRQHS
jgi:hypothetical protein